MTKASFGTRWVCLRLIALMLICHSSLLAVPAPKTFVQVTQPDGSKLTVMKKGDEFFHYAVSKEGYTLMEDASGVYRYTVRDEKGDLIPGPYVATDPESRNSNVQRFLSGIQPGMRFSERQRTASLKRRLERTSHSTQRKPSLRSASSDNLNHLLINDFPLTGNVRSLVILVNFSDKAFTTPQPDEAFHKLLNQEGYNVRGSIGSVRDYYISQSGGTFQPEFVVVGPVTLGSPMAYYGRNVNDFDVRPRDMIREACLAVDHLVDFSQFDNNGDGKVDNVYVFYAGKGEADSGLDSSPNAIWPHTWFLPANSLRLDGKYIEKYACSGELDGSGNMTGMGVFTHEFGHVLGLPDMYDADKEENGESFDPDAWSLMAYGSYNNNGKVPPSLTMIERYLLGWSKPTPLTVSATPELSPLVESGQGFIITTHNEGEFFLLENRQQIRGTWDEYIPYHGMLIYHIDTRNNASTTLVIDGEEKIYTYEMLWLYNLVNCKSDHQCVDIEEADNIRIAFNQYNYVAFITSFWGDPFPGSHTIRSFTDSTIPSMKSWEGTPTNKPITRITEQDNGSITFDFMGGMKNIDPPLSREAHNIQPFSFEARWHSVKGASGYLLNVFTLEPFGEDSIKTYIGDYYNYFVDDTSCIIHVPNEQSVYYYLVRSTNGFIISEYASMIGLSTTNSKPVVLPASHINPFHFRANWESQPWATGYYLTVFEIDTLPGGETRLTVLPQYNHIFTPDTSFLVDEINSERSYGYIMAGTDGIATGVRSDTITLSTPPPTTSTYFVRDNLIYLKGADPGSTVIVYDLDGRIIQRSTESVVRMAGKGLYIVEYRFRNTVKRIKVLLN